MYESVSGSDNAVAQRVLGILNGPRAGLVTDIDGTISPIVAVPTDAIILPEAREALVGLREVLEIVAVVTGRSVQDARQMVGIDGLTYIGNHGLEVWRNGAAELVPEAKPWVPRMAAVLDELRRRLKNEATFVHVGGDKSLDEEEPIETTPISGAIIEDKGVTASIHYRLAPDPPATRRRLLEILARSAVTSGIRVEEGRMVINLLPPLTVTKGSAVTWLVREHALERIVYLGDDITDAHAFKALAVLRQASGIHSLAIGVVGPETPPSVTQLADAQVPTVQAVADLLWSVLDGLKSSDTMVRRAPPLGSD